MSRHRSKEFIGFERGSGYVNRRTDVWYQKQAIWSNVDLREVNVGDCSLGFGGRNFEEASVKVNSADVLPATEARR
jgi:hypothetical protein